jgi:solute carrier family 44 (choline transporter-like protein), member 2/4/5
MFFWLITFVIGMNESILAGCFGAWYWTRFENANSELKNRLPLLTLFLAMRNTLFYHFGTIAFGSMLIAIVKLIRLVLDLFTNFFKKHTESAIVKPILCCVKCCFWCVEKVLAMINHYAFIVNSIYSKNFMRSAVKAFKIITMNVLRVAVTDKITNFILFLSNLMITGIVVTFSFFFFTKRIPFDSIIRLTPDLNYYFLPIVVIGLGVFAIGKLFFDVFAMGVDTMLMCVLIDIDVNDGTEAKRYFMSKNLKKILNVDNIDKKRQ